MLRRLCIVFLTIVLTYASAIAAPGAPWIEDAVVYGVIPALMGSRGLADVADRLDDLADLGATAIWLSPITEAPPDDFGYAVTDHFHIRASLGSEADLRHLVEAAHKRGLKVLLDIPSNDLSDQHPFYRDLLKNGNASPYGDFFARGRDGEIAHYFNWTNLKNLNYDRPAVRSYGIEIFHHWLRDFDVDGFRVDAAWGPRERSPDFWPQWSAILRRTKFDILLIAEASARDPYYGRAGFDAAYDWSDRLGEWAWADAFETGAPAVRLRMILGHETGTARIFRFLDNNDTGRRFVTRYGAPMTRVALAMLLTLPGIPCIYMGEEVGAAFEPYATRTPIPWVDRENWRPYVHALAALRHHQAALHSPTMSLVGTGHDDAVLAYLRSAEMPEQTLLILLNYGKSPVAASVSEARALTQGGAVEDLLDGERFLLDATAPTIPIPALSARILHRVPTP